MYSVFFVLLSLFLLSLILFFLNKQNQKILVSLLGGQKRGFAPHPNYWGARARAAPPESTPMPEGAHEVIKC